MPSPPASSRPRRAAKPTARRAAAVAPSSTAPPRVNASKVTKPKRVRSAAERRSDTAVTANLVGGATSSTAAAAQKEVVAPEPPVPSQPRVATPFRYSAQVSVRHVRDASKAMQADSQHQMSDATDQAITMADAFLDRGVKEEQTCTLVRKVLNAGYFGLAERNWVPGTFTPMVFASLVEHLKEWHEQGKQSLVIKVTAFVRDVTMEDVAAEAEAALEPTTAANTSRVRNAAAIAAAAAVAPRARNAATLGVRNTATNQGLARMPVEQELMEVGGNYASGITAKWTCTQRSCASHQRGCCYWTTKDEATFHVPIISAVLTAWAEKIRDGELTASAPSQEMYGLMMQAKIEGAGRTPRGGVNRGITVNANTYHQSSPVPTTAPPPPRLVNRTSSGRLYSSPVRMPSDPPELLSDLEQLDAFFTWCKSNIRWMGYAFRLDEILTLVKANGDNVHTMANISKEDWRRDINVADGYRKRLKMSAKEWANSGMPTVQGPA
jgi:hypothetical protein